MENLDFERSLQFVKQYGSRTSSFITLYPHFKTYSCDEGILRYVETDSAWIAGTEPFTKEHLKATAFAKFAEDAKTAGKSAIIMPIGEALAEQLKSAKFNIIQSGIEPVFELSEYFGKSEPLDFLPIARALKARGGIVREIVIDEIDERLKNQLQDIYADWLKSKDNMSLQFLSVSEPFCMASYKRFFVIESAGTIQAFLTAVPIYEGQRVVGYYFADWIRSQDARAGSVELLIIQSMRMLHAEGIKEVRLGNCALAGIKGNSAVASFQRLLYKHYKGTYKFKSLFEFKNKLRPTRWDTLYIASNCSSVKTLIECVKVHQKGLQNVSPLDFVAKTLLRIRWTVFLATSFILIHLLKVNYESFQELYLQSAYIPGDVSLLGIFWGPLFHNHLKHLIGDQLSLLFFGAILEYKYGAKMLLSLVVFGLWLSNPLTHIMVAPILSQFDPQTYQRFLAERDYGSSNAVYAIVGGLSARISTAVLLLLPFALNGVIVCYEKQSILALHHHISLVAGFIFVKYFCRHTCTSQNSKFDQV